MLKKLNKAKLKEKKWFEQWLVIPRLKIFLCKVNPKEIFKENKLFKVMKAQVRVIVQKVVSIFDFICKI